jgi:tetratricopeptide (TPR) repeat protein
MKRALLGLLLVLGLVPAAAAATPLFSEANAKYLAGDFKSAASIYEKLLDADAGTGSVYYNLGNASLRLGRKGEAMLYYQRALRVMPRDRDLRWNIRVLSEALVDRIEKRSGNPLATPVERFVGLFTADEAAIALTAALALLALLTAARAVAPSLKASLKGPHRTMVFLAAAAALLTFLEYRAHKDPLAVVLERQVTAYYGPSERETKAFTLHEGALGRVIDSSGDWIYLALDNGTLGWVRKNGCELV